jgi:hypothetical protein
MRRWFIVLMVLLMPIRGIMGDAMAYAMVSGMPASQTMVQMHSAASQPAANTAASRAASNTMPCHMGKLAKSDMQQPQDNNTTSTCSACQVCHASVLPLFTVAPALLALPSTAPAYTALAWHSAEPRQLAKNPIL